MYVELNKSSVKQNYREKNVKKMFFRPFLKVYNDVAAEPLMKIDLRDMGLLQEWSVPLNSQPLNMGK